MAVNVKENPMGKKEILNELEKLFGTVPDWVKETPENTIEELWNHLKKTQTSDITAIPPKYKELISLSAASALGCRYCTYFHTEAAKLHGASEDEIKGAILTGDLVNHPPISTAPSKTLSISRKKPIRR